MAQDNKGSDLSDLKSRLGLSESEEQEENEAEGGSAAEGQQAQGPPPGAQQGGAPQGGPGGPQQGGPPQNQGGAPTQGGGPSGPPGGGPPGGGPAGGNAGPPGHQQPAGGPGGAQPPSGGGPPAAGGGSEEVSEFGDTAPDDGGPGGFEGGSGAGGGGLEPGSAVEDEGGFGTSTGAQTRGESFGDFDEDLEADEGVIGQGVLTKEVLGLTVVVLIIGGVFGVIGTSSYQGRWLYSAQTRQAQQVLDALGPKVENFKKAREIIKGLDSDKVQYDQAKKLSELDLTMDMSALSTDKLLLGGQRINMLTSYLVQAERLESLIKTHNRKTNETEKKKLQKIEKIASGGKGDSEGEGEGEGKSKKEVEMDARYATVFSFEHLNATGKNPQKYEPKAGQIVKIPKELKPGDGGKVQVELLNSGRKFEVDVRGIVPLSRGQLLSVGGQNAFGRYQYRVRELKHLSKKIAQQTDPDLLAEKLKKLAERGAPPLIQL